MNTFKHILVPTDFSASSSAAIELAIGMATQLDAELTLMHVWELPIYPYVELIVTSPEMTRAIEKSARECLETQLKEVRSRLPRTKSLLKMGLPWQQIVDACKESDADLLIMGTHGRRGLEHAILGSVAEKVVRLSSIPVLTVRGGAAP
jgi:nucleotide-binding universal stress UspA family protein